MVVVVLVGLCVWFVVGGLVLVSGVVGGVGVGFVVLGLMLVFIELCS